MPAEQQETAEQQRECQPDQHPGRQHQEDRGDAEVPRKQRNAIAGRTEEQGLTETHDARIPPHHVERQCEQRKDDDTGGKYRQVVMEDERQEQRNDEHQPLDNRQNPAPRGGAFCRRTAGRCIFTH